MKLLILTQKVDINDPVLGFFHRWIEEFAKNYESIVVICLYKGEYNLPTNVEVFSLGKEMGVSKFSYVLNFYSLIWKLRNKYNSVFVHMNYIYVLLGGLFWKGMHKKISLWYVHRQASFGLWLSEKFVNNIFTSSPESFTVKSNKVNYIGHGIDSELFKDNKFDKNQDPLKIISIGRITQIKNLETLIEAAEILKQKIPNLLVSLYGDPSTESDKHYVEELKQLIKAKGLERTVLFKGVVNQTQISRVFSEANLSVNLSPTGGWDKVVIESLMAKCPVFASNLALEAVYMGNADKFLFEYKNPSDLTYKVSSYLEQSDKQRVIEMISENVIKEYDIRTLVKKILAYA